MSDDENIYDEWHNAPKTKAGARLLKVMATVPPQGRKGLAWFVDAIEVEARNLGYADRLDEHINGRCDEVGRLKDGVVLAARVVVVDFLIRPASLSAQHVRDLDALRTALIALGPVDGGDVVPRSLRGTDLDPRKP
jgi:hypothetical protein